MSVTDDFNMQRGTVYLKNASEVPISSEHFAIITFETISEGGYSRDDQPYNRKVPSYQIYASREAWEAEIKAYQLDKKEFVPIVARRPAITVDVKVSIT
jgi:hypothetical protein